jgi:hypothetical protein
MAFCTRARVRRSISGQPTRCHLRIVAGVNEGRDLSRRLDQAARRAHAETPPLLVVSTTDGGGQWRLWPPFSSRKKASTSRCWRSVRAKHWRQQHLQRNHAHPVWGETGGSRSCRTVPERPIPRQGSVRFSDSSSFISCRAGRAPWQAATRAPRHNPRSSRGRLRLSGAFRCARHQLARATP